MSLYEIQSYGISDLGLVRTSNEDLFHSIPLHHFFALADGMGGHNAGEIAAREVIHHLSTSIHQLFASEETKNRDTLPSLLYRAITQANAWVHRLSEQKAELSGMGTTLCCLLLHQDSLVYANVGDSRIYRFREELTQITEDHSLYPHTLAGKNIITRAIGTGPYVEPDIHITAVKPGDLYFLCSDGLTDYVSDIELLHILRRTPCIQTASAKMVQAAKDKGGHDNITILMVRVLDAL
ncbi:MAG: serine/threonine-protein phosphatase [Chlamydiae bacterium]|nr:serine/threonine-protein phosphatase [Chlamydiota bacterium]